MWAFRDEVAARVRAAEFSDLQGLVQGLSTGVQGELAKLAKQEKEQQAGREAGLALRVAPRPVYDSSSVFRLRPVSLKRGMPCTKASE